MSCGKVCHRDNRAAAKAFVAATAAGKIKPNSVIYYCAECEAWHIGRNLKQTERNKHIRQALGITHEEKDQRRKLALEQQQAALENTTEPEQRRKIQANIEAIQRRLGIIGQR